MMDVFGGHAVSRTHPMVQLGEAVAAMTLAK